MARRPRGDHPGAWHHAMNRGIARRPVFEDRACVRYFLSLLAREVRKGDLEVHSFVFMTTHYHLLVRSPTGRLSECMGLVQNLFVRWFNRRNRRDGPLFRGRFLSRPVESLRYCRILVSYIDHNPVLAGLVKSPEAYPHGSARHYALEKGPRWLERSWVEGDALKQTGASEFSLIVYRRAFGRALTPHEIELVDARLEHLATEPDPLDDLVRAAPAAVGRWMQRKAALADRTRPGLPCASAGLVSEVCSQHRQAIEQLEWTALRARNRRGVWGVLLTALLRDVAGLSWVEISRRISIGESTAKRRYQLHRTWMGSLAQYREAAAAAAADCLRG